MTRTRRPEHPFPLLERGSPSPHTLAALLTSPAPSKPSRQTKPPIPLAPYLPESIPYPPRSASSGSGGASWVSHRPRTPALRRLSRMLRQGARVLLDLDTGRCLLYSCSNGIKVLGTITIRMLSQLLRLGDAVMAAREDRWIHFASPQSNLAWFRPEGAV